MWNHQNKLLLFFLLLFSNSYFLNAQGADNPFELKHRLEEGDINRQAPVDATNPFDVNRLPTDKEPTLTTPTPDKKTTKATKKQRTKLKGADNFVFWLITIMLILMTFMITLYKVIIEKSYRSFINENFLKMVHRDQGRIVSFPYMIFYILFFINLSILIFLIVRHFDLSITSSPLLSYFICLGGVILAFVLKHVLLMVLGSTFPLSKEIRQYSFTIIIFSIILGLILVPFNLLIAFTDPDLARVLIYSALGVIAGIYAFRSIRALIIAGSHISLHTFHFFMYLCTAEIAPAVLLGKLILSQG